MIKGKKIFLTGGTGFLGQNIIQKYYGNNDITVFSRDEAKQYFLKKKYKDVKFIIGDIRNFELLKEASKGNEIGIFAASLKQIQSVNENVEEAIDVIIKGGINSKKAAIQNDFESACFISSDKSRSPSTLYGAMKLIAGQNFIANDSSNTKLSCAIYGNVLNSTGSIIPLIWDSIKNHREIELYSEEMTRFIITTHECINLIEKALLINGYNVIPKISSIKVKDLFDIYANLFGLKYKLTNPRPNEKIHEILLNTDDAHHLEEDSEYYYQHYCKNFNKLKKQDLNISSEYNCLSIDKLDTLLKNYNYFKPDEYSFK